MYSIYKIILIFFTCLPVLVSCKDDNNLPAWQWEESSTELKPRYIWIDAAANFPDYANSKENIKRDLTKVKNAGFTDIVVDIRPTTGDVLFQTSKVGQVRKLDVWRGTSYEYYERTSTWDYLEAFIEIGHALGLKVNASMNTFVGGNLYSYGLGEQGMVFRDPSKKSWCTTLNLESGLTNIMDLNAEQDLDNEYGTKFLNPANADVQDFVLSLIADLAKYDLDGIFLDRCRYNDFASDFSDVSRQQFESYMGVSLQSFPGDIIKPGTAYYPLSTSMPKYFKKWLEFRAKVIHDFIYKARNQVKAINSNIKFGVYVGGWYSTYYDVGVNWASPRYNTSGAYPAWATPEYMKYGYADLLDFMLVGAYASASDIYGSGEWTMQGFCKNARNLLMGDVKFAGGPDVGNAAGWENGGQTSKIPQTVDACINTADGYFIFDISQVKKYDYWDSLKSGIDSYLISTKECI